MVSTLKGPPRKKTRSNHTRDTANIEQAADGEHGELVNEHGELFNEQLIIRF